MNKGDDLLGFLIEDLSGQQRDLVTRAFYKFAEGDPASGPVNEAILLTACTRRLAQAPKELREAIAVFKKLVTEGQGLEARIRERVEVSNREVVASFKDEAARATAHLRTTAQLAEKIGIAGQLMNGTMQQFVDQGGPLLAELRLVKALLHANDDSTREIAEATRTHLFIGESTKALAFTLTRMACVNWTVVGVVVGSVLTLIAVKLPWWVTVLSFAISIGLLQWWQHVTRKPLKEYLGSIQVDDDRNVSR